MCEFYGEFAYANTHLIVVVQSCLRGALWSHTGAAVHALAAQRLHVMCTGCVDGAVADQRRRSWGLLQGASTCVDMRRVRRLMLLLTLPPMACRTRAGVGP
jgi:hypothetical protein